MNLVPCSGGKAGGLRNIINVGFRHGRCVNLSSKGGSCAELACFVVYFYFTLIDRRETSLIWFRVAFFLSRIFRYTFTGFICRVVEFC